MSLEYEPSSEQLHISAEKLFLIATESPRTDATVKRQRQIPAQKERTERPGCGLGVSGRQIQNLDLSFRFQGESCYLF
jgi:hypothetical protein